MVRAAAGIGRCDIGPIEVREAQVLPRGTAARGSIEVDMQGCGLRLHVRVHDPASDPNTATGEPADVVHVTDGRA